MIKIKISKEELVDLYTLKKLSIKEISELYKCYPGKIKLILLTHGIRLRTKSEVSRNIKNPTGRFLSGHKTWNKGVFGEKSHCFGRKMSDESKIKLSNSRKGIKFSDEHRKKMSISAKNRKNQPQGENHGNWKGGRYFDIKIKQFRIMMPEHPQANSRGYVLESRLIAEKALGRPLKRTEIVHHINGDTKDNRNSNLLICTQSYHYSLHWKMKKLGITF